MYVTERSPYQNGGSWYCLQGDVRLRWGLYFWTILSDIQAPNASFVMWDLPPGLVAQLFSSNLVFYMFPGIWLDLEKNLNSLIFRTFIFLVISKFVDQITTPLSIFWPFLMTSWRIRSFSAISTFFLNQSMLQLFFTSTFLKLWIGSAESLSGVLNTVE